MQNKLTLSLGRAVPMMLTLASASVLLGTIKAQETSVDFYTNNTITGPAGIDNATGWNNLIIGSGEGFIPNGNSQTTPSIYAATYGTQAFSISGDGCYNEYSWNPGFTGTNSAMNNTMLGEGEGTNGSTYSDPVTLTISGLTVGAQYNLTAYLNYVPQNPILAMASLTDGGNQYFTSTYAANSYLGSNVTSFVDNATAANITPAEFSGTGAPNGYNNYASNYIQFNGFTASSTSEELSLAVVGTWGSGDSFVPTTDTTNYPGQAGTVGLSGVQITGVPEPSATGMFCLGLLGVLMCRYIAATSIRGSRGVSRIP
jgi:hypothetical protein